MLSAARRALLLVVLAESLAEWSDWELRGDMQAAEIVFLYDDY